MPTAESAATNAWAALAEVRVAVYRFLLAALDKPTPEQHAWLACPGFRQSLEQLCERFELDVPPGELAAAGPDDHQARYIASFEVGLPTPSVVLLASHYNRREPVTAIIHEHKLFYRRFRASPKEGWAANEPADHLLNELAFLIHLDELLLSGRIEAESILRGRYDFLCRHPARWLVRARDAAHDNGIAPVYVVLLCLLTTAVDQDLALTKADIDRLAKDTP
jgi:TorA maturation chaperone TorD